MAPEYVMRGHFSIKSDVFSYGVLVLEIISGKKNSGTFENDETKDLLSFVSSRYRGLVVLLTKLKRSSVSSFSNVPLFFFPVIISKTKTP